jgi:proteasome lid subunit RPN8/RPN11
VSRSRQPAQIGHLDGRAQLSAGDRNTATAEVIEVVASVGRQSVGLLAGYRNSVTAFDQSLMALGVRAPFASSQVFRSAHVLAAEDGSADRIRSGRGPVLVACDVWEELVEMTRRSLRVGTEAVALMGADQEGFIRGLASIPTELATATSARWSAAAADEMTVLLQRHHLKPVGFMHTHPHARAIPSVTDRAHVATGQVSIIGGRHGTGFEVRAWVRPGPGRPVEENEIVGVEPIIEGIEDRHVAVA